MIPRLCAVLCLMLVLSGCAGGLLNGTVLGELSNNTTREGSFTATFRGGLFSHTVEPITFNRQPTPLSENLDRARGSVNQVQFPPLAVISIRVGRNGIGDVARKHGLKAVYYADLEKWSAFFGLWQRQVLHIYGR
jgi:hypothetical protein